jgi:hypothetical protein
MRKIYMTLSASATLVLAIALNSCNNAEEVKKQTEEQAASIQTQVDEKLSGLQAEIDAECAAVIDSLANVQYTAYLEETAKSGKKGVVKPKPKPAAKAEPKPTVGDGKPQMGGQSSGTIGSGKPKMGDTTKTNTVGSGKPKMGTSPK